MKKFYREIEKLVLLGKFSFRAKMLNTEFTRIQRILQHKYFFRKRNLSGNLLSLPCHIQSLFVPFIFFKSLLLKDIAKTSPQELEQILGCFSFGIHSASCTNVYLQTHQGCCWFLQLFSLQTVPFPMLGKSLTLYSRLNSMLRVADLQK